MSQGVITNKWGKMNIYTKKQNLTPVSVQDIMRAGVYPCKALVHECNAGNSMSSEACVGAMIACNNAETVPYQMSGYNPYDMRIKCDKFPLCYDFSNVETFLNRYIIK